MQIAASIDYWGEEVATFDPEKVLNKLELRFPEIIIDPVDHSQVEVEKITEFANKNLPEPRRSKMIGQIQSKNKRNGPVYQFILMIKGEKKITGYVKRYRIEFESENSIDSETQQKIIDFLESLKLGKVVSKDT